MKVKHVLYGFVLITILFISFRFIALASKGTLGSSSQPGTSTVTEGGLVDSFTDSLPDFGSITDTISDAIYSSQQQLFGKSSEEVDFRVCNCTTWCNIEMPETSYFRFEPPTDAARWHRARTQAAYGDQVLLQRIVRIFSHYMDFLDGDTSFRSSHSIADFFIGENRDLKPLTSLEDNVKQGIELGKKHPWEEKHINVLPDPHNYKMSERAPVVKIGYFAFYTDKTNLFQGAMIGGDAAGRTDFFKHFDAVKKDIKVSWIPFHSSNENWGMISTFYPNRTADWGSCCNEKDTASLKEVLDHEKTLMMLVNQHTNYSHPKLLVLPRGMPIYQPGQKALLWDTQRMLMKINKKDKLVFTATSNFGSRPQILKCVKDKFSADEFYGQNHVDQSMAGRMEVKEYVKRLGSARFGLCLPGLGYDTFRLWETMNLGSVAIIERGVGFDKTVSNFKIDLWSS